MLTSTHGSAVIAKNYINAGSSHSESYKKTLKEYNDKELESIVDHPNIRFQISNYMSLASKNYAKYPSYYNNN